MRKLRRKHPLTVTEQALYHELVALCNEDGWGEYFTCSNAELCDSLQITKNTLVKARAMLIQVGLICFESGKSRRTFSNYSFPTTSNFDIDKEQTRSNIEPEQTATRSNIDTVPHPKEQKGGQHPGQNLTTIINVNNNTKHKHQVEDTSGAKKAPTKKQQLEATPYWQKLVDNWFDFYRGKFKMDPTFNGAAAANFKKIVDRLKILSEKDKFEWTEENAMRIARRFFTKAYEADQWMRDNFLISNLYSKFDSIVTKNGTQRKPTGGAVDTASAFAKIDSMPG